MLNLFVVEILMYLMCLEPGFRIRQIMKISFLVLLPSFDMIIFIITES